MSLLDAIAIGAATGAVGAVAYLAHELGIHAQKLLDHERRLDVLETNYSEIQTMFQSVMNLIRNGV